MDSTSAALKAIGILGVAGTLAALDMAPFLTIVLTILAALASGVLAARYAVREARKEIDIAFRLHVEQLHSSHEEFIEAITDDRTKLG